MINGLSPMVLVFWIGLLVLRPWNLITTLVCTILCFLSSILLLTVLITDVAKAYLADKLRVMITPRLLTIMNVILGVVLIGFGVQTSYCDCPNVSLTN